MIEALTPRRMRYAAYGSNLHPLRLQARVPSAQLLACVSVTNWQLVFHKRGQDGSGKCSISPAEQSVYFAVYEMEAVHKPALDKIEGLNKGYELTTVAIPGYGDCFAYIASHTHTDERLKPFTWYKELVLAGVSYHRLPAAYCQIVESVAAVIDEDTVRHEQNMALAARARAANPGLS